MAGLQAMEKSETEPKDLDSTITDMVTETYEIEFVEVENDRARIEPTMDAEYQSELNFSARLLLHRQRNVFNLFFVKIVFFYQPYTKKIGTQTLRIILLKILLYH